MEGRPYFMNILFLTFSGVVRMVPDIDLTMVQVGLWAIK